MSNYTQSATDLIDRINNYVKANEATFLSVEVTTFINDEYTKAREKLIYDSATKVEENNFHNLTTVFHMEKLWEFLHEDYVIRRGRPSKEGSRIDIVVLETLKSLSNGIITGFEPLPNPEFTIGGYKIPDDIKFEGVKRGRKLDSMKYYSFIDSYNASKQDPVAPAEKANIVKKSGVLPVPAPLNAVNPDNVDVKIINSCSFDNSKLLEDDNHDNNTVGIQILKKKDGNRVTDADITPTETEIVKPIPLITPKLVTMISPASGESVSVGVYHPAHHYHPLSKHRVTKPYVPVKFVQPSPKPEVKEIRGVGRPMGSKNKTPEEKALEELNKRPVGKPRGSVNKGATAKSDEDVIIYDNEIMLRVNPSKFDMHMLQYTINNADKCYAEWIDHANEIVGDIYDCNKVISRQYLRNWDKHIRGEINTIVQRLSKNHECRTVEDDPEDIAFSKDIADLMAFQKEKEKNMGSATHSLFDYLKDTDILNKVLSDLVKKGDIVIKEGEDENEVKENGVKSMRSVEVESDVVVVVCKKCEVEIEVEGCVKGVRNESGKVEIVCRKCKVEVENKNNEIMVKVGGKSGRKEVSENKSVGERVKKEVNKGEDKNNSQVERNEVSGRGIKNWIMEELSDMKIEDCVDKHIDVSDVHMNEIVDNNINLIDLSENGNMISENLEIVLHTDNSENILMNDMDDVIYHEKPIIEFTCNNSLANIYHDDIIEKKDKIEDLSSSSNSSISDINEIMLNLTDSSDSSDVEGEDGFNDIIGDIIDSYTNDDEHSDKLTINGSCSDSESNLINNENEEHNFDSDDDLIGHEDHNSDSDDSLLIHEDYTFDSDDNLAGSENENHNFDSDDDLVGHEDYNSDSDDDNSDINSNFDSDDVYSDSDDELVSREDHNSNYDDNLTDRENEEYDNYSDYDDILTSSENENYIENEEYIHNNELDGISANNNHDDYNDYNDPDDSDIPPINVFDNLSDSSDNDSNNSSGNYHRESNIVHNVNIPDVITVKNDKLFNFLATIMHNEDNVVNNVDDSDNNMVTTNNNVRNGKLSKFLTVLLN